jgi:ferric-dicitrate binding protein FerR (iron transport regulator)
MDRPAPDNRDAMAIRILKYLDGTLPEGDVAKLNAALQSDPDLRQEFASLLVQRVQLEELGKGCERGAGGGVAEAWRPAWLASWRVWAAAAAALVLIVGALALFWPGFHGTGPVPGEGAPDVSLVPGTTLRTGDKPMSIHLGGYCRVQLGPGSRITLEGQERAQQIHLAQGDVTCDIDGNQGSFTVRTDVGTVTVLGTLFTVRLVPQEGESMSATPGKLMMAMAVAVVAGNVSVNYDGKTFTLGPGQSQVFAGDQEERIKSEDPPAPRSRDDRVIIARGVVRGTVVEKGDGTITVKSVSGKTVTYLGHWENGRKVTEGLENVKVGDRVGLRWAVNDHYRVIRVEKIESGNGEKRPSGEKGDRAAMEREAKRLIEEAGRLWKEHLAAKERGETDKAEKLRRESDEAERRAHELQRKLKEGTGENRNQPAAGGSGGNSDQAAMEREANRLKEECKRLWQEHLAAKERGETEKAERLKQESNEAERRYHELRAKLKL